MKMLIEVKNFTIPKNWNPKEPEAVKKRMEADERHSDLKKLHGL